MSNLPDTPLTPYQAANLLEALKLVEDTGDWHGELRLKCEAILTMEPHPPNRQPGIVLTAQECATLKPWLDGTVSEAYGDQGPVRWAFAQTPVGRVMAKIAEGARGARS